MALDEGHYLGKLDEADVLRCIIRGLQETWEILIADGVIGFPHDQRKSFHEKSTPQRKPKELRAKVTAGRKLESKSSWPKGRKIESRNDLRRS